MLRPRNADIVLLLSAVCTLSTLIACGGSSEPTADNGSGGAAMGVGGAKTGAGGTAHSGGGPSGGASASGGSLGSGGAATSGTGGGATGGSNNGSGNVACGARAGNTCASDEYCAYAGTEACGAADGTSTCKKRPQICTDIYAPVCGCDGKTYASDCTAAANGVGYRAQGECPVATPF